MEQKAFNAWLKKYLRKISKYWPERTTVYHRCKVAKGKYKCESCEKIYKQLELQIDHLEPVIDVKTGFIDWNTYISRLFCDSKGLQALCKECHNKKTLHENQKRREIKKSKKKR
jgi:5-methylcytosine-specific restriction endonuclease McrA